MSFQVYKSEVFTADLPSKSFGMEGIAVDTVDYVNGNELVAACAPGAAP